MIYMQSMGKVQVEEKSTMPMELKPPQPLLTIHMVHMDPMETMEEQKFITLVENDLIIIW